MKRIQFTAGCLNRCSYCYEPSEMRYFNPAIPEDKEIQILDMNFLANPNSFEILDWLPKRRYELVCGVDYRRLNQTICNKLKEKGFVKMRWAWDYGFSFQKIHKKVWEMFKRAGFRSDELSVFVLVNWKIPFFQCCRKLDLLKVWNVKVNDCCYDGGYPKSEIDYNNNKRFNDKRLWKYEDIRLFRRMCRKHNQIVRFKIDPEL